MAERSARTHTGPKPPARAGAPRRRESGVVQEAPDTAVLLATGAEFRTRSGARPKMLCRVGGVSLLERSLRVLRAVGIARVLVVVGRRGTEVAAAAAACDPNAEIVHDPSWTEGTAASVLAGVRAAATERCLVVMGDHVFDPADVRRLLTAPGRSAFAVSRDAGREIGGLAGRRPTRLRIGADGRIRALGHDLTDFDAVSAGLSVVQVADLLGAVDEDAPPSSWVALRQRLVAAGHEVIACDTGDFWAAVDSPEGIKRLERAMWRRYGPKPTDSLLNRVFTRRISGPFTRLLLRTGITPDTATYAAFVLTLAAAALVATGERWLLVVGGIGVILGCALDGVDGELARVSGRSSRRGAVLDTLLDRYADLAVVVGLVFGAGATVAALGWGLAAAAGCLLVSYVHAVGRDTDVRLLLRREFRLLIFAVAAVSGFPLWGLVAVAVPANVDVVRGVVLLLRATR
ncbi:MAG: NTP transferase domain-containing protein [Streptosporangiales bacterium]|nr:NTP transferase domain-containing protein [Streptosporangiales bacterium]